jgi:predicted metal-binding membrane protein
MSRTTHAAQIPEAARRTRLATRLFVLAYLLTWTGFALLAMVVQWTLDDPAAGTARHPTVLGLALAAAGIYQWTPLKHTCLEHCRAPLPGMLAGWRHGLRGALERGAAHAWQSLGCCWLLMLLLAAGPDNPAIGLLVLVEMRLESGHWIACGGGLALLACGTRLLFP